MKNIYHITISQLKINTIIGILPDERKNKQNIILDVEISYTKNIILDYSQVRVSLIEIFQTNHFFYLEDALDLTLDSIIARFSNITNIALRITKPEIFPDCTISVSKEIAI